MGMRELGFNFKVAFLGGFLFNLFSLTYCSVIYEITSSTPLLPGKTLISPSQIFELGFFSPNPNHSDFQYVGLWFKQISPRTYLWVANRENPITDSSASLTIGSDGNLWLLDGQQNIIWSTNVSKMSKYDSIGMVSDDGMFALKDNRTGNNSWDSFLNPTDTQLPGTGLTFSKKNGHWLSLTSWKTENDPSPGDFVSAITGQKPAQTVILEGSKIHWRSGPWDNTKFIGIPEWAVAWTNGVQMQQSPKGDTPYASVDTIGTCNYSMFVLSYKGVLRHMCWETPQRGWYPRWEAPITPCSVYGACGPSGVCRRYEPNLTCRCLKGFVPKSNEEWIRGNWSGGCVRRKQLNCRSNNTQGGEGDSDGFSRIGGVMLPDLYYVFKDWDENECHKQCLRNCSCSAYAYVSPIGCMFWGEGGLVDIVEQQPAGLDLFLRLAHSELGDDGDSSPKVEIIVICVTVFIVAIVAAMIYGFWRWRKSKRSFIKHDQRDKSQSFVWRNTEEDKGSAELPLFDFDSILIATNNFGLQNKLGQGGYGPVYKGKLPDGKDVAVKRLSSSSGQGQEEFKNEVKLISKLKHRNLVRLIGCCIEGEEKILIYEYMPNKSVDTYLFNPERKAKLDWKTRMNIIIGVARGLLYLHRDSCLRVIHRDLKVSNILLDEKMNPKISDFGLARIFEGTQDLGSTHRVVGTIGYMAPEYLLGGVFSEKSDVFGFGVLVLEIVSGRKVNSFQNDNQHLSLVAYAWDCWCKNSGIDMADQALGKSFSKSNTSRCVNIGLLCVQDNAADRPTMAAIVSMLSGEKAKLPQPKQPAFALQNASTNSTHSLNYVTQSTIEPR